MGTVVAQPAASSVGALRSPRAIRLGQRRIEVVGPSIRDPRIHLSITILTIITIGTVWLGFRLSVPQILLTMAACGLTEAAYVLARTRRLVWPASALQTATSTVLLFRVIGTEERGDWTFYGCHIFVAVGLAGLATKYVVRIRGGHVFNPSNIALVGAFVILGDQRVEPLDFWWAPIGPAMIAAYAVIFAGGVFICWRLRLLGLGLSFWLSLAAGMGILAALGHTITTRWSFTPVGGAHFWWIVLTSPEIFIFLFFMITDPKTVPAGRVARVVFGVAVGATSSLLMAPWDTEFGVKVGLLSGLVVVCAVRPFVEHLLPAPGSEADRLGPWLRQLVSGPRALPFAPQRMVVRSGVAVVGVLALGGGVAVAGLPNSDAVTDAPAVELSAGLAAGSPADVDPRSLPIVTIDREVGALSSSLATSEGAQGLAATLVWNLRVEAEAIVTGDASLLPAITDGQRLHDLTAQITTDGAGGERIVPEYTFASLHLGVVYPGGFQRGANAGLVAEGEVTEVVYGADGSRVLARPARPFAVTFSMRQTTDGRWLTTDTLDPGAPTADGSARG